MIFAPMTPKHSHSHLEASSFWICLNRSAISWKKTSHCTAHCKRHSRNHVLPEHGSRIPKSCHFWWISDVVSCIICPSLAPKIDIRKKNKSCLERLCTMSKWNDTPQIWESLMDMDGVAATASGWMIQTLSFTLVTEAALKISETTILRISHLQDPWINTMSQSRWRSLPPSMF